MKELILILLMVSICVIVMIIAVNGMVHTHDHKHKCPEATRILSLEQQMVSRTRIIKKLGYEHNYDIMFVLERHESEEK